VPLQPHTGLPGSQRYHVCPALCEVLTGTGGLGFLPFCLRRTHSLSYASGRGEAKVPREIHMYKLCVSFYLLLFIIIFY
jgi:hypothetical protein